MKKENGVTLISLVLYVIVMSIVLTIMTMIINNFSGNMSGMEENIQELIEFNKFNTYFLKEIKSNNNEVDSIADNYILFASGNSFSLNNGTIYYNNLAICNKVKSMQVTLGVNGDGEDRSIINVTLAFEKFSKTISYKVENVY